MKIYGCANKRITTLKARLLNIKNKKHYNLILGSKSRIGWEYRISIDDTIAPNMEDDYLMLNDDYSLHPVFNNDKIAEDKRGNQFYYLTRSNNPNDDGILVAIWHKEGELKLTDSTLIGVGVEVNLKTVLQISVVIIPTNGMVQVTGNDGYIINNKQGTITV